MKNKCVLRAWLLSLFLAALAVTSLHARPYSVFRADSNTTQTKQSDSEDHTNLEQMSPGDRISISGLVVTMLEIRPGDEDVKGAVGVSLEVWGSTFQVNFYENSHRVVWVAEDIALRVNIYTIYPSGNKVGIRLMKETKKAPSFEDDDIVLPSVQKLNQKVFKYATSETRADMNAIAAAKGPDGKVTLTHTLKPWEVYRVEFLSVRLLKVEKGETGPLAVLDCRTDTTRKEESLSKGGSTMIGKFTVSVEEIEPALNVSPDKVQIKIVY